MLSATQSHFDEARQAFALYVESLHRISDAMFNLGVQTRNVDVFSNYAEVIVAKIMGGAIQRATNAGYDVLTPEGLKIQVKSLRVSSAKPGDNGIDWRACVFIGGKPSGPLIHADRLAIVVYQDFLPYALLDFPIVATDRFPVLGITGVFFSHAEKLIKGRVSLEGTDVRAIDLRNPF